MLRAVPGMHELAVCGESLGDLIAGGDRAGAKARWGTYKYSSVVGSAILLVKEQDEAEREERRRALKKAAAKAGVCVVATGASVGIGIATAGVGVAAAAAIGGVYCPALV